MNAKALVRDPSLIVVILGNLFSMGLAYFQGWDIGEIMWVYWGQSVVIGITNFIRMMTLKEFTTAGLKSGGHAVPETQKAKRDTAFFFALHYGFFHLVYAVFLMTQKPLTTLPDKDIAFMLMCIGGFALSHGYSFVHNRQDDFKDKKPNLGTLLFYPYLRIIPMHMTILAGSLLSGSRILMFMSLKTLADAGTHMIEHAIFQQSGDDSGENDA